MNRKSAASQTVSAALWLVTLLKNYKNL